MRFTITRKSTFDQGTFGILSGEGLTLQTAELPWRDNANKKSCIPPGTYKCVPHNSAKFPNTYRLESVPNREGVLIHSGNYAGDTDKGLRSDVSGCILVGSKVGTLSGQKVVTDSRVALNKLRNKVGKNEFTLTIIDATGKAGGTKPKGGIMPVVNAMGQAVLKLLRALLLALYVQSGDKIDWRKVVAICVIAAALFFASVHFSDTLSPEAVQNIAAVLGEIAEAILGGVE
ncbi:DUF5675 family protein [Desulfovibrio sp. OttesenSCG-928-G15]|nr:DUF5675 family protein [Desulfovibrio sp. OttesenSCG-928-G15]